MLRNRALLRHHPQFLRGSRVFGPQVGSAALASAMQKIVCAPQQECSSSFYLFIDPFISGLGYFSTLGVRTYHFVQPLY